MGEKADQHYDLCGQVIGCAMRVHGTLGSGFLESVYRNALALELRAAGLTAVVEHPIAVRYREAIVGSFAADLLVNDALVVELKAVQILAKAHEVQLVNYLTATGMDDGLVLNFGAASLQFKRKYRMRGEEEVSL